MRIEYAALPAPVRAAVEAHTGPVRKSRSAEAGVNSAVAAILDTETGPVFLKADPDGESGAGSPNQERERAVNPYIRGIGPALLWHEKAGGWNMLAFEVIEGDPADYSPGSPDLPKLAAALASLAEVPCPPVPMLSAARRWAPFVRIEDQERLAGPYLLHTDPNPNNVLVTEDRAWLVDWAWSTRGAGFIDLGCLVPRLVDAGHSLADAEDWAAKHAVWQDADPHSITVFAQALARMWGEYADKHPAQTWRRPMAQAAATWAIHRADSH